MHLVAFVGIGYVTCFKTVHALADGTQHRCASFCS